MDKRKIAKELLMVAKKLMGADTFECPTCGTNVLEKTKYCVKCKKKVAGTLTANRYDMTWKEVRSMYHKFRNQPTAEGLIVYTYKLMCGGI